MSENLIHGSCTHIVTRTATVQGKSQPFMDQKLKFLLQWTAAIGTYLIIEWFYNQHLLVLLTYPTITEEQLAITEFFGKMLAAFGINFVIKELFNYKGKLKFAVGVLVAYGVLSAAFNYMIDSVQDEFRYTTYYGSMYRKDVVLEKDKDKILDVKINDWYTKPLLTSIFFMTFDADDWKKYEKDSRSSVDKKVNTINVDKNKYWQQYQRAEQGRAALAKGWSKYLDSQYKYDRYKYTRYRARAHKVFLEKVGLPPDLSENEFYQRRGKEYFDFLKSKVFEGVQDAQVAPIYGKDIPQYMSQKSFFNYVDRNVFRVAVSVAPKVSEIKLNKVSRNTVAVILVPPVSLTLSFLSITINIFFLILMWCSYGCEKLKRSGYWVAVPALIMVSFAATFFMNAEKETIDFPYWNRIEQRAAEKHPVLSTFWAVSLKGQRLLCPDEKPTESVVKFTERFYGKKS